MVGEGRMVLELGGGPLTGGSFQGSVAEYSVCISLWTLEYIDSEPRPTL